jgi:GAF domain
MPGTGTKQQQIPEPTTPIPTAEDLQITPAAVLSEFEQMCVAIPVSGAIIAVRDMAGIRCTVSFGNALAVGSRLPIDYALTRQCIETGEVALSEGAESEPRAYRSVPTGLSFRSAVAAPIQVQGNVVGLIEVFCSRPSAFSPTAMAGLKRVAKLFAALLIFDAANGGQPVIGGSLERPIVLPRLVANQEPTTIASSGAEIIEKPKKREVRRRVTTTSQLPSDKPTPTRVWLIAAALLLALSILFLLLFGDASGTQDPPMESLDPQSTPRLISRVSSNATSFVLCFPLLSVPQP